MMPEEQVQRSDNTVEEIQEREQVVLPLLAEEVSVAKERVVTGQVKVGTITREREQLVEELLEQEHIEVERTAIGKQVDKAPPVRQEGDTLVIPVLEEIVVVERRLLLKEEVRIHRTREKQPYQERVVLRKQEAVITRL
jgi:uncharacterized protein (TIGR02271 family)